MRSGDMVHVDEDGWFFFDYRKGGGLRRAGDFIQPEFVETVIGQHHYYRVEKGFWKTYFDYPDTQQNGFPNPFMAEETPEFSAIEEQLTNTEKVIYKRPMLAMQALHSPNFKDGKMDVFFGAKTCILVLQKSLGISNPDFGAGLYAQNMVLAAHSMGLGTCYIGFVSSGMKPLVNEAFLHLFLGLVFIFGIGYYWISLDAEKNRGIIWLGFLGKSMVVLLLLIHLFRGNISLRLASLGLVDLWYAIQFMRFLVDQDLLKNQ